MQGLDDSNSVKERFRQMKEVSFNYDLQQDIMVTGENCEFSELVDMLMEKLCCDPWFTIVKMKKDVFGNVMEALEAVKSEIDGLLMIFKLLTDSKVEHYTDSEVDMLKIYNQHNVIYIEVILMNDNSGYQNEDIPKREEVEEEEPIEYHQNTQKVETFKNKNEYVQREEYQPQRNTKNEYAQKEDYQPQRNTKNEYAQKEEYQPQRNTKKEYNKPDKKPENPKPLQYRPRIKDLMENEELKQQVVMQDRRTRRDTDKSDSNKSKKAPYERKNYKNEGDNNSKPYKKAYEVKKNNFEPRNEANNEVSYEQSNEFNNNQGDVEKKAPKVSNPYQKPYTHYASYKNASEAIKDQTYHNANANNDNEYKAQYAQDKFKRQSDQSNFEKQSRTRIMK